MNAVRGRGRGEPGAVLLEVILALALFSVTAAIVTTGINSSVNSVERLRLTTHAGNLAATVVSEIKLGDRSSAMTEAEPFEEPFTNWTYQVVAGTGSGTMFESTESFQQVEVVIRNVARPFEFRFGELLPVSASSPSDLSTEIADDF